MNNFSNMLMGGEQFRKMDTSSSTYSPKSSPHAGGRSPVVSRQDSSGTLKTTISLGKTPTIIQTGPFYSMKEPPGKGELTGDKDLMTEYGLHHTLTKFKDKKVKESLASFLPNLPGIYDGWGSMENSTLRSIIEKPPIGGKELLPLSSMQLAGFRLHPGPLPEQYHTQNAMPARKHKNKHKKHKHKDGQAPPETSLMDSTNSLETYEKKHKKQKRHEDDKERKKRKKEKKRKKKSHSPEPSLGSGSSNVAGAAATSGVGNIMTTGGPGGGLNATANAALNSGIGLSAGSLGSMMTNPVMQSLMANQNALSSSSSHTQQNQPAMMTSGTLQSLNSNASQQQQLGLGGQLMTSGSNNSSNVMNSGNLSGMSGGGMMHHGSVVGLNNNAPGGVANPNAAAFAALCNNANAAGMLTPSMGANPGANSLAGGGNLMAGNMGGNVNVNSGGPPGGGLLSSQQQHQQQQQQSTLF